MHLALSADVTVTGKSTFTNLADAEDPAQNLVGIAQSASQGAITARQLDARPVMRTGEVLETVPGVVISQHSGEGKANQYYLRGFNLDHGTDFATTVAGHAGQHADARPRPRLLGPELPDPRAGRAACSSRRGRTSPIRATSPRPARRTSTTPTRWRGRSSASAAAARASAARWPPRRRQPALVTCSAASRFSTTTDRGIEPDDFRKVNGLVRYSQGDAVERLLDHRHGLSRPLELDRPGSRARAIDEGIDRPLRHASTRPTAATSYRYSGSFEWQRTRGNASTKLTAFGIGYDLNLFSNFTYFLDDPDRTATSSSRPTTASSAGARLTHRRLGRWAGRSVQNTFGVQLRNDDIANRRPVSHARAPTARDGARGSRCCRRASAASRRTRPTWTPWLRTLAGVRVDGYRFDVDAGDPANSGTRRRRPGQPEGRRVFGPWRGTELYVNAGLGFHSNDARGATITRRSGDRRCPPTRVTPLARARGAEVGVRTRAHSASADRACRSGR